MFSIVIPLYNKVPYIGKAIESVLEQTVQDFELIIVEDGSTDGSLQEVNKYPDTRLRVICQENAGVSAARNKGVQYAKFDFIAFLDADDWWDKHFLEEMARLINDFPEAKLYGSSYYIVKHGISKTAEIGLEPQFKAGYIDYFKVYSRTFWVPFNCSFVVIQRSAFEQIGGFKTSIKFGEDFDLWARIAVKEKVAYVNKPLAYSNQDVNAQYRALGSHKFWSKEEHITFNFNSLQENQQENNTLIYLLDGLKVRSLVNYYLKGVHHEEVSSILETVNWNNQSFFYKFIYTWPKWFVQLFFSIKLYGSKIKNFSLTEFYKYSRQ
ncbi:glycosyltransferase [Spirosoma sp. BT702]|uniref:Glycosyltransferase n=1 Tax=Spirosoma profusum TaxID=2771354 RepID=A0A927ATN7_9BACT|nr:glycosyltransferase [Spirosoma profusum]MBD2700692.1 glycosyltransferase [Spirosoma profusum]